MNSGLDAANPALVAAFRSALLHQAAIIAVIFAALGVARLIWRGPVPHLAASSEPLARKVLRLGFGVLWLVDGVLQAQPKMAGGLPAEIVQPVAQASPRWVQSVADAGGTLWTYHPVQAAAAAVWIQAGLGLWLLAAATGRWSRLAGLASVAWGLIVWIFGEAFGGIFAPGLSWLTGAPGAVLLYIVGGVLLALPLSAWPRAGRILLVVTGVFWTGMAVLQAWPGRGFWQGGGSGTLSGMVASMAHVSQPRAQAALVSAFADLASADGLAVNVVAVVLLGGLGLIIAAGAAGAVGRSRPLRVAPRLLRVAVAAAIVFCVADWVLVQDFGMPGGLGTDPNSMPPWAVLLSAGYLAVTRPGAIAEEREVAVPWRTGLSLVSIAAIVVGVAPMAAASADRNADPVIARAITGGAVLVNRTAPGFRLTSQAARPVSLTSLRGKVLLLTFFDPLSASPGATIAQELRATGRLLGPDASRVELVAIPATANRAGLAFIRAFDRRQRLTSVPDWLFLTGTLAQLQRVWASYEILAPGMMAGMMGYGDVAFIIDATGRIRQEIKGIPGPASTAAHSSFAVLLSDAARQTLTS